MFTKTLLRSVATSAAVGSVVAASLVATPSMVTAEPQIRAVACDVYAPEAETQTSLSLSRTGGQYGMYNTATATVTGGDATPTGTVRFTVYDVTSGSATPGGTVELADGQARLRISRYLRANRTYMVTANYTPDDACEFQPSAADAKFYTVFKRRTSTDADAPGRRARQRPVVEVAVAAGFTERLGGRVRVVITKANRGRVLRSATVRLRGRSATVSFRRLRPGAYTARVSYLGNANYSASSGADGFRVRR